MDGDPVYLTTSAIRPLTNWGLEESGGRGLGVRSRWQPKAGRPKEKPSLWLYVPYV